MNTSSEYGLRCPYCSTTVDGRIASGAAGACPKCGTPMIPNTSVTIAGSAYCKKCKSISGITGTGRCPVCNEPYAGE